MAASSIDVPPQPEKASPLPMMLGKARGLTPEISAAAAAAVATGRAGSSERVLGGAEEAVGVEPGAGGETVQNMKETTSNRTERATGGENASLPYNLTSASGQISCRDGEGIFPRETRTERTQRGRRAVSVPSPGLPDNTSYSTPTLARHTRAHLVVVQTKRGRINKSRHRLTQSTSTSTKTLAAAVAAAIASTQQVVPAFAPPLAPPSAAASAPTPPATSMGRVSLSAEASVATDIAKLAALTQSSASATNTTNTTNTQSPPTLKHNGTTDRFSSTKTSSSFPPFNMTAAATAAAVDKDSPVLSFWGPEPVPLPSRFLRIKRNLIRGHEAELEAGWTRLLHALRAEVDHIESLGAHLIPSIEFSEIGDATQSARFSRDLQRYGVGVVRKVVPKPDCDVAVNETINYLNRKSHIKAPKHDPTCFDFFWTPAQVRARAHPSVLGAQRFMMSLWKTTPDDRLVTRLPITYVDRLRVHGGTQRKSQDLRLPSLEPPQSADDWISALESSAGVIAQVDNGSLERWEPDGYQHAGTYNHVFQGRWEEYDPWECASRASATMDLYNGYGACTIFRMFQGVLAMTAVEPGMVRLLPSPKLATAYYLLRPFFSTKTPPPENRSGPQWDAYLAPENWKLERDPDSIIHGAVPGHAQRITEHWHPHLHLRGSMITLPTLQPGDYIFWHPDLPYYLSDDNYGLKTPSSDDERVSMLLYVPAAPLTQTNALYLARQRKAFHRGHPGPDFDSTGQGNVVEDDEMRPGEKQIAETGGPAALQAMGLAPWEAAATRAGTPPNESPQSRDKDMDMETDARIESLDNASQSSRAEAEVVRLANIILFPDQSMMGYSV